MLIRRVHIGGGSGGETRVDVRVERDRIAAVAPELSAFDREAVIDGCDGALLPGLHDHHLHLLALAAARRSLRCGPPEIRDADALATALRAAARDARRAGGEPGWIRGVGHHESAGGELDAARLDAWVTDVPVRIQHRSGALWVVNTRGLERLGLAGRGAADEPGLPEGVERRADGCASGRLFRCDAWLRGRLGGTEPPDLSEVGAVLARFGVCGVTDATPHNAAAELRAIGAAVASGALPQRVHVMGRAALPASQIPGVSRAARKLVLHEQALPDLAALAGCIASSHEVSRAVAVHCVTRAELVVALAAFEMAGARPGDRIEHASVAPPELALRIAELGLCVVTQPGFVRERGDAYLADVDAGDRGWLYRCRGLLDAGVALGAGTDAPFGDPDPWLAVQAAVERRTAGGQLLGAGEALSPERALALFTTPADAPGAAPRRVEAGERADLCLLDRRWASARDRLASEDVAAVWIGGRIAFRRDGAT